MAYILTLYFCGYTFLGMYLLANSDELALLTCFTLVIAAIAHAFQMALYAQRQRRTKQLLMFSHQVMPYIHLIHPTCNYHNLNK